MKFLLWFVLILLSACATSPGGVSQPPAAKSVAQKPLKTDSASLLAQLNKLPGAMLRKEPLGFSYPGETMFGKSAVLPLPGGPKLLDPLAELLKQNPQLAWQVEVRANTGHGQEYNLALAAKRSELLAAYLLSKGAELGKLDFQPTAAAGDPLVFTLKTGQ